MVEVGIVTGHGINAEEELGEAFRRSESRVRMIHIQDLIDDPERIRGLSVVAFPGGFSFGDHLGSGLLFAHLVRQHLREHLDRFVASGGLVLGVCNGFQVLVKMGILPNLDGNWAPSVSLVHNESGVFEDSWVGVEFPAGSPCVWTQGLVDMELPIRHGEGRFIVGSPKVMDQLETQKLVAVRYSGRNPNGSQNGVAGITDPTGRILGLMPHPEAFLLPENHPRWTRSPVAAARGLELFANGIQWAAAHPRRPA